jgi:hypothetical protein
LKTQVLELVLYAWRWHSLIFLFNQNIFLNYYYLKKTLFASKVCHPRQWNFHQKVKMQPNTSKFLLNKIYINGLMPKANAIESQYHQGTHRSTYLPHIEPEC